MSAANICLVFLTRDGPETPLLPELVRALTQLGCKVEVVRFPFFLIVTRKRLARLKALLYKRSRDQILIFCPDSTELFLNEPDFTLAYSAYHAWYNPKTTRVIPHLWGPIKPPESKDHLKWNKKPPLRIGFMGTSHETSRLARCICTSPGWVRRWLLTGQYLRFSRLRALMNDCGVSTQYMNAFLRIEVLDILKQSGPKCLDLGLDIVERRSFTGSERERNEYVDHLSKNTYIVCPRGTENFSYRMYEALSFGRVPVLIDTDMVLPPEINWDRLVVRVPYKSIQDLPELIRRDYNRQSDSAFLARQQEAFSTMANLNSMRWVQGLANELLQRNSRK